MTFAPPLTGGAKVMQIIIKHFIKGRMIFTPSKQLITPLHDFEGVKIMRPFMKCFIIIRMTFAPPVRGGAKVMRIYTTIKYFSSKILIVENFLQREEMQIRIISFCRLGVVKVFEGEKCTFVFRSKDDFLIQIFIFLILKKSVFFDLS